MSDRPREGQPNLDALLSERFGPAARRYVKGSGLTREELLALPAVVDLPTAALALDVSRTAAYELVRADEWPTPTFRAGKLIRVPTAPILRLLGIEAPNERERNP